MVSNVFTLSTAGIKPTPKSVVSIFWQDCSKERMMNKDKTVMRNFFTKNN